MNKLIFTDEERKYLAGCVMRGIFLRFKHEEIIDDRLLQLLFENCDE